MSLLDTCGFATGLTVPQDGFLEFLAKYGGEWTPSARPKGIRKKPQRSGRQGSCFHNATKLVLIDPTLDYVEGIASSNGSCEFCIFHAWAVTKDGQVVDNTWSKPQECEYFGVRYDRDRYIKFLSGRDCWGVIASYDDWGNPHGWIPLATELLATDDAHP